MTTQSTPENPDATPTEAIEPAAGGFGEGQGETGRGFGQGQGETDRGPMPQPDPKQQG